MYIQGTKSISAADPHTHGTSRPVVGQRSRLSLTLLDRSAQQLPRKGLARQHKDIMTAARRFNQLCIKILTGQYHIHYRNNCQHITPHSGQRTVSKSIRARRLLLILYIIYESQWARLAHAIRIPSGATLVLTGVKRTQAETGSSIRRPRLLMILPFLQRIRSRRNSHLTREDDVMPWATVTLCFFGFFRAGEMTVLS